ncbi:hypothetical protein G9A89_004455 [Geosiphon pyriformis]|nr:hypothetical protein G9A89_004455 [Geosiphon pyriformis]
MKIAIHSFSKCISSTIAHNFAINARFASSVSSKNWIARQTRDQYVKKAMAENYRARSIYKLMQLDEKYQFIQPKAIVVDCGAAPGSWSQYIAQKVFPKLQEHDTFPIDEGRIIAIDLLPIEAITGVNILKGDFNESEIQTRVMELLEGRMADVVVSDMAPNFSGQHTADHARSMELCESALRFSEQSLKQGGTFLCKFLMGGTEHDFKTILRSKFTTVKNEKPSASRAKSTEGYFMCFGYRILHMRKCHEFELRQTSRYGDPEKVNARLLVL